MKTVAMLLYPGVLLLDVAGPLEVFSVANRFLCSSNQYQIITVAAEAEPMRASNGARLLADKTIEEAATGFDVLLVPGGPEAYIAGKPLLAAWLNRTAQQSAEYGSICTGAFLLGEAGLLDGRRVTTHWNYKDRLMQAYPKAIVDADQIYVRDKNLITSGGVTAGIDMALAIVADHHGKCVALDVAKVLVVTLPRQELQSQFSPLISPDVKVSSKIAEVQRHILENIDGSLNVDRLAEVASMSARNFARIFTREMGMTPAEFVQNARVDRARKLLENSDVPVKTVAYNAGFRSERHMRILFKEKLGLTPAQYRLKFN